MGIRGEKQYGLLFNLPPVEGEGGSAEPRGRNPELIELRNEHLLHRFVYIGKGGEFRFEYVVKRLAQEFYLTESTVGQIIEANGDLLARVRREWPEVKELRRRWGWMVW